MKKKVVLFPTLILSVFGVLTGAYFFRNSDDTAWAVPNQPGAQEKAKVIITTIAPADDTARIIVPARIEAKVQSLVTADIEGNVVGIRKPLGSTVKAREAVLYVENRDPGFTYAAVAIRSPIAGVIHMLAPSLMSKVSRGDKLFSVIDPKSLKLTAEIPGSDLSNAQIGAVGKFTFDLGQKDSGLPIRISGVSPTIDSRTGTAPADLEFILPKDKKTSLTLPPIGSLGHAVFEMVKGKVILIPDSALIYAEGKTFVRVLTEKNTVLKKAIKVGEQRESQYTVTEGLASGDRIIVRATRPVKDGDGVEVETPKQG